MEEQKKPDASKIEVRDLEAQDVNKVNGGLLTEIMNLNHKNAMSAIQGIAR